MEYFLKLISIFFILYAVDYKRTPETIFNIFSNQWKFRLIQFILIGIGIGLYHTAMLNYE